MAVKKEEEEEVVVVVGRAVPLLPLRAPPCVGRGRRPLRCCCCSCCSCYCIAAAAVVAAGGDADASVCCCCCACCGSSLLVLASADATAAAAAAAPAAGAAKLACLCFTPPPAAAAPAAVVVRNKGQKYYSLARSPLRLPGSADIYIYIISCNDPTKFSIVMAIPHWPWPIPIYWYSETKHIWPAPRRSSSGFLIAHCFAWYCPPKERTRGDHDRS